MPLQKLKLTACTNGVLVTLQRKLIPEVSSTHLCISFLATM